MITLKNINKAFKDNNKNNCVNSNLLFKDLSLNIHKNDLIRIHGENGSGKTSLLKIIKGFMMPCSGEVIFKKGVLPSDISYFSQNTRSFFLNLNVYENLNFFTGIQKNKLFNQEYQINKHLDEYGLIDKKYTNVSALSSGELKKLILIRGLLQNNKIMLFDEITNSFDDKYKKYLFDKLKKSKKTIIWVSHEKEFFQDNLYCKEYIIKEKKLMLIDNNEKE